MDAHVPLARKEEVRPEMLLVRRRVGRPRKDTSCRASGKEEDSITSKPPISKTQASTAKRSNNTGVGRHKRGVARKKKYESSDISGSGAGGAKAEDTTSWRHPRQLANRGRETESANSISYWVDGVCPGGKPDSNGKCGHFFVEVETIRWGSIYICRQCQSIKYFPDRDTYVFAISALQHKLGKAGGYDKWLHLHPEIIQKIVEWQKKVKEGHNG